MQDRQRQKIAILGGGMAALTAAFELTNQPDWQQTYDITLYQMGWRLGGKGASGRNLEAHARIEEHGLHIFMGMYENTFSLMRQCYGELGRDSDRPLATWQDAFKPHSFIALPEQVKGQWSLWAHDFPRNDRQPGEGQDFPTVMGYIGILIEFMIDQLKDSAYLSSGTFAAEDNSAEDNRALDTLPPGLITLAKDLNLPLERSDLPQEVHCLYMAHDLVQVLPSDPHQHTEAHHRALLWLLRQFKEGLEHTLTGIKENHPTFRRLFILVDLAYAVIHGMIVDRLIVDGFDRADGSDFQEWLRHHGAEDASVNAAVVRGMYDLVFGYENGDVNRPNLAAGSALRYFLRWVFSYGGTFFWKMQAGMGDTIFTPLYEVLKQRGVTFKFFHVVKNLGLSADQQRINTITIERQATVKQGDYNPLVSIKDLPCWPSTPRYEQLVEGEALQAQQINLESAWTPWQAPETITLKVGEAFDQVILGIPLGVLPHICPELIAARKEWQLMVAHVKTVQTLALQVWLQPNLAQLGWRMPSTIIDGYAHPLNTWADMSHLDGVEDWPPADTPGHIGYFCGPLEDAAEIPPLGASAFPEQEGARVKTIAQDWFEHNIPTLWPQVTHPETGSLNWDLLVDPHHRQGQDRFEHQYWRANVEPSDRYVMSVKGSTQYRLSPDRSGFNNLYLVGDWTKNPLNLGCIEATVMSGMQASQAISGYPTKIVGSSDV